MVWKAAPNSGRLAAQQVLPQWTHLEGAQGTQSDSEGITWMCRPALFLHSTHESDVPAKDQLVTTRPEAAAFNTEIETLQLGWQAPMSSLQTLQQMFTLLERSSSAAASSSRRSSALLCASSFSHPSKRACPQASAGVITASLWVSRSLTADVRGFRSVRHFLRGPEEQLPVLNVTCSHISTLTVTETELVNPARWAYERAANSACSRLAASAIRL